MTTDGDLLAPGELRLVHQLLNTRYGQRQRLHDEWPDREAMATWLREHGLLAEGETVTDGDYRRAVEAREIVRLQLQRTAAGGGGDAALVALNPLARHLPLRLLFSPDQPAQLAPESGGVDGVLARALGAIYTAMQVGTWSRLKVCQNAACGKAFYDTSKNHAGVWCSMQVCGNRMHARAYRLQHKQQAGTKPEADSSGAQSEPVA